jgi:tRNA wybutosine-synthesizing protein 3
MGLAFESLVGFHNGDITQDATQEVALGFTSNEEENRRHFESLLRIANDRFYDNAERIRRFRDHLLSSVNAGAEWENAVARKERKRAEGLKRQQQLRLSTGGSEYNPDNEGDLLDFYGVLDLGA